MYAWRSPFLPNFLIKLIEFILNFLDFLIFKFPAGSLADLQLSIFLQDLLQKPVRKRTKGSSLKGFCKKSERFGLKVLLILQILEPFRFSQDFQSKSCRFLADFHILELFSFFWRHKSWSDMRKRCHRDQQLELHRIDSMKIFEKFFVSQKNSSQKFFPSYRCEKLNCQN